MTDISTHPTETSQAKAKDEFWYAVYQCLNDPNPKVDFDKLAVVCGYKNADTARTIYGQKKRQRLQVDGTTANVEKKPRKPKDSSGTEPSPAKKRGRKPKDVDPTEPTKKRRGRPKKSEVVIAPKDSEEDDSEADTVENPEND